MLQLELIPVRPVFRNRFVRMQCDRCDAKVRTVGIRSLSLTTNKSRGTAHLCAECLAVALEALTDFGWSNQLRQWTHQREAMAGIRDDEGASPKARSKRREREALTRRRLEAIDG